MTYQFADFQNPEQTVVALHSSASNGGQWKSLARDCEGRYNFVAPDLPGYGRFNSDGKSDVTSADATVQLIEKQGTPVHLIGHSNGGAVAVKVALTRPDLVKSLTLYEPATFHFLRQGNADDRKALQEINLISGILTAGAASGSYEAGMSAFIDFWNGAGFWNRLDIQMQERLARQAMSVMADFANGYRETWTLANLATIKVPTLVMMGMESPNVAQTVTSQIAAAIPTARLAMIPGLNHMAPVSNADWVNPRILQHVASVERPTSKIHWPAMEAA